MKQEILKNIIELKRQKKEFAIVTNLENGNSIFYGKTMHRIVAFAQHAGLASWIIFCNIEFFILENGIS